MVLVCSVSTIIGLWFTEMSPLATKLLLLERNLNTLIPADGVDGLLLRWLVLFAPYSIPAGIPNMFSASAGPTRNRAAPVIVSAKLTISLTQFFQLYYISLILLHISLFLYCLYQKSNIRIMYYVRYYTNYNSNSWIVFVYM